MNVGEYGVVLALGTGGFDVSSKTGLSLTFTKPDGSTLTVTSGVAVGSGAHTTEDGDIYASHEYVTYTFANGDVDQSGEWSVRLTYDDAVPQHLISDAATFTVND